MKSLKTLIKLHQDNIDFFKATVSPSFNQRISTFTNLNLADINMLHRDFTRLLSSIAHAKAEKAKRLIKDNFNTELKNTDVEGIQDITEGTKGEQYFAARSDEKRNENQDLYAQGATTVLEDFPEWKLSTYTVNKKLKQLLNEKNLFRAELSERIPCRPFNEAHADIAFRHNLRLTINSIQDETLKEYKNAILTEDFKALSELLEQIEEARLAHFIKKHKATLKQLAKDYFNAQTQHNNNPLFGNEKLKQLKTSPSQQAANLVVPTKKIQKEEKVENPVFGYIQKEILNFADYAKSKGVKPNRIEAICDYLYLEATKEKGLNERNIRDFIQNKVKQFESARNDRFYSTVGMTQPVIKVTNNNNNNNNNNVRSNRQASQIVEQTPLIVYRKKAEQEQTPLIVYRKK